jgi:hypothetical protein
MRLLLILYVCVVSVVKLKKCKNAVPDLALEKRVRPVHDTIGFKIQLAIRFYL